MDSAHSIASSKSMALNQGRKPPIFVVGPPRSGTTLTAKILGGHPKLDAPGETHFFIEVLPSGEVNKQPLGTYELAQAAEQTYHILGDHHFDQTQEKIEATFSVDDLILAAEELGGRYQNLYLAFINLLANISGAEQIVDDTPRHIFYVPTIYKMFPNAKFVGLIRDPRDFMASYKFMWKATSAVEEARIRSLYHPILTSLYWRAAANTLLKHHKSSSQLQLHLVRYEDLVQDPEREVRKLIDFLGYQYSPLMLNVTSDNSSFEAGGKGIYSTSLGRWRRTLTPHEIWIMQTINRGNLQQLGYPIEPTRMPLVRVVIAVITAPLALIKTFWTNRDRRGALIPYLARRLRGMLSG